MILERIRRGQRIEHFETVRQRKHGSLIGISLTISPIENSQGTIVGASKIARDITERKRRDAQMLVLAREAEHRARNMLSIVLATVQLSHADTAKELKRVIEGRIQAISNVAELFALEGSRPAHPGHAGAVAILSRWHDAVSRRGAKPDARAEAGSGNRHDPA